MKIKLTTLIVIVVLAVAGTVGVMLLITNKDFGLMRTDKNNDGIVINEQENVSVVEEKISNEIEEKNENNKIVKKLDDSKEIVYDKFKNSTELINVKIPFVNIDSNYANEINKSLEKYDVYQKMDDKEAQHDVDVTYEYYVNDNVLSLYIVGDTSRYDKIEKEVFNIDIYTGEEISNKNLLDIKNLSESEYKKTVLNKVLIQFDETYKNETYQEIYDIMRKQALEADYSIGNKMFFDDKGHLNCIVEYPTPAGEGVTWLTLDTEV